MLFKEITGQEEAKRKLIRSFTENRLAHAQLFLGPSGTGGLPLALAFAQYLNCENKQEYDACGQCASCTKAAKLVHPDIHFSYPFISSKTDKKELSTDYIREWREALLNDSYLTVNEWIERLNAANKQINIPIKECHDIIRRLNLKTYESPYKVMILWLPEYLGKEGNTLLKIIEEPPENTVFLLVSEDQDRILNTILSRTQVLQVKKLSEAEIQGYLVEKYGADAVEALKTANAADGDLKAAIAQLDEAANDNGELFAEWMRMCYNAFVRNRSNDVVSISRWVENMAKIGRENQKSFFRYSLHLLREMAVIATGAELNTKLPDKEQEFAVKFVRFLDLERIGTLAELFDRAHYYVERNANPKILFMHLSITAGKLLAGQEVELENEVIV